MLRDGRVGGVPKLRVGVAVFGARTERGLGGTSNAIKEGFPASRREGRQGAAAGLALLASPAITMLRRAGSMALRMAALT